MPNIRRTAAGSVTVPRIRRGPPQRSQTSTSKPNTRWSNRAHGQRLEEGVPPAARTSGGAGRGTTAALQPEGLGNPPRKDRAPFGLLTRALARWSGEALQSGP
jgi:hypothetical protein